MAQENGSRTEYGPLPEYQMRPLTSILLLLDPHPAPSPDPTRYIQFIRNKSHHRTEQLEYSLEMSKFPQKEKSCFQHLSSDRSSTIGAISLHGSLSIHPSAKISKPHKSSLSGSVFLTAEGKNHCLRFDARRSK